MNHHQIHKIVKIYTQTKLDGREIDNNLNVVDIFRDAEQCREIYSYNRTTYFCCYKTKFKNKPAVMLLFVMNLSGPPSGSSSASEYVISILSMIEKQFTPIDDTYFIKEFDSTQKNIGFLKIIKVIREDDLL